MNIYELEKEFEKIVGGKKNDEHIEDIREKVFDLYSSSFKIIDLPSDELLAIVRSFDDKMCKEENGVKYLDKSLREMVLTVAFVTQCTDLDMKRENSGDNKEETNSDMIAAYDAIIKMWIDRYFYHLDCSVWSRFTRFMYLEEEVFFDKYRYSKC